ncbi:unnamed protein product [Pylaiella littoralis]
MAAATTPTAAAALDEDKESSDITIEILQQHFHQPLMAVAEELGVSLTMIKRLCRKLGMPRWPFRQIDSINKAMEDLHDQLEGARTEADRTRYYKALEEAEKKKQLITRGAAAGVDPNVRNALYLADTANVSEEDIFGNPELMPKLSAALKTITKRKRVKGKPLVDLIATVQRDGSLPACVQASNGSAATTPSSSARAAAAKKIDAAAKAAAAAARSGGGSGGGSGAARRQIRPPAIVDAIATSHEEYAANIEHAYGGLNKPESSTSDTTSVSPAHSSLGNSGHSSIEENAYHGWGHNTSTQQQQQQQQQHGRHSTGNIPAASHAHMVAGAVAAEGEVLRGGRVNGSGYLQESFVDSPTSSCTTLVAGNSPSGGDPRFSPGGSFSGGFPPAMNGGVGATPAPTGVLLQQPPSFALRSTGGQTTGAAAAGTSGGLWMGQVGGRHQQQQPRPQKRLSTSSAASTDPESLDTSQLLEFDDDEDDEVGPYGGPGYTVPAGDLGYAAYAVSGGGSGGGGGGSTANGVSPEDLQELEDALLMDSFTGAMDEVEQGVPSEFPKVEGSENINLPGLHRAAKQPLSRQGGAPSFGGARVVPRRTPRSAGAAGSGCPHVQMFGGRGVSPSHAGSASPNSPRVGSSPPTPGTPGTQAMAPGGGGGGGGGTGEARMAPSPNGRRRGDEAFPPEHFALPSPNNPLGTPTGLIGGPSPKSRRVGTRFPAERFPGSPQAGLSPRAGFPPQSSLSGGAGPSFSVTCSPLGGSDRTYFPAPVANAAAAAAAALADGRGHRRSNSSGLTNGWGSAPRHGGGGECGLDAGVGAAGTPNAASAAAAAAASISAISTGLLGSTTTSTSTGQNWSVRLGDSAKPSWGLTMGEGARPPSPMATITTSGQQQQRPPQQKPTATSRARSRGVVRRRHSSPLSSLPTSAAGIATAEWAGEVILGMGVSSSAVASGKAETNRQSMDGGGSGGSSGSGSGSSSNVLESFSPNFFDTDAGADGAAKWGGLANIFGTAPSQQSAEGKYWQQQQQQQQQQAGVGGLNFGTSGASSATGRETSSSRKFEDAEVVDVHVMTTMPVDL